MRVLISVQESFLKAI